MIQQQTVLILFILQHFKVGRDFLVHPVTDKMKVTCATGTFLDPLASEMAVLKD